MQKFVFVVGCQRSGTTLLGQALGAHPNAVLIDENDGVYAWIESLFDATHVETLVPQTVLAAASSKYQVPDQRFVQDPHGGMQLAAGVTHLVLKVPNLTYSYQQIASLPFDVSIVSPIRDPRAVVVSMAKLPQIPMIQNQIRRITKHPDLAAEFSSDIERLQSETVEPHVQRAIIWRMKNSLFGRFVERGVSSYRIRYEDFVSDKETYCGRLAYHVGLRPDERMTGHERIYVGTGPGYIDRMRAIDTTSIDAWTRDLSPGVEAEVLGEAGERASAFGYSQDSRGLAAGAKPVSSAILDSPVIFVGRGGSGTRLLAELAANMGFFIGNELNNSYDAMEMVEVIYALAIAKMTRGSAGRPMVDGRYALRSAAELMLRRGGWQAPRPWGWKLPETMLIVPEAVSAFKNAKVVHFVRHPVTSALRRTHITSRMSSPVGAATLRAAYASAGLGEELIERHEPWMHNAVTWLFQVKTVCEFGRSRLGPGRYVEIKYEDVCADPEASAQKVAAFTGVAASLAEKPQVDPARMSRVDLNDPRVGQVWDLCKDVALQLGYDLNATSMS